MIGHFPKCLRFLCCRRRFLIQAQWISKFSTVQTTYLHTIRPPASLVESIADAVAPRDRRERSTMEGAGQCARGIAVVARHATLPAIDRIKRNQ